MGKVRAKSYKKLGQYLTQDELRELELQQEMNPHRSHLFKRFKSSMVAQKANASA
jgi:hypothetical protein